MTDSSGQTVRCSDDHNAATLSHPTDSTTHNCNVYVRYSRVAIVTADGKTLHEWFDHPKKLAAEREPEPEDVVAADYSDADGEPMHGDYEEDPAKEAKPHALAQEKDDAAPERPTHRQGDQLTELDRIFGDVSR